MRIQHLTSGEDNPADEVSRGVTVDEMSTSSKWLSLEFLKKKEEFWPCDPSVHQPEPLDDDPEIKHETQSHSQSLIRHRSEEVLSRLVGCCSSWGRLRRAVAWLLRFGTWFIKRHSRRSVHSTPESSLKRGS